MTHDTNEIKAVIRARNSFYIAGHTNPDGDAIGACFGLGLALEKMGKKVRVLLESYHSKYDVIPGKHLLEGSDDFDEASTFISLDCADENRLPDFARKIMESASETICIDHHYTNTHFAKYNYVDGTASSASEMVYQLLGTFLEIDRDIASALYAGVVSDTGGFRHSATSQNTLRASASLVATGIPFTKIYTELVHLRSYTEVKLLGRILEASKRSEDGKIVYACVTKEMFADAAVQDIEGVVEILLNIRGAEVSLLIYDRGKNDEFKISLRSRSVSIGEIAKKFGGGGHVLAAGANIVGGDIYAVCEKVLVEINEALRSN